MSQATPPEIEQGYAAPCVRQFSVFLDNKVGKLLELVRLFEEEPGLRLCGLSVVESSDFAVVRLIPSSATAARMLLRRHQFPFSECDLLIVELGEGHSLSSMCIYLLGVELNIHFAYPLMIRERGSPTIALAVDDRVLAGQILARKRFRLLGEADLA